jgi:predicted Zn-dependent protease
MSGSERPGAGAVDETDVFAVCDRVLDAVGDRAQAVVAASAGRSGLTRFAVSHIHQNVAEDRCVAEVQVTLDGGRTATTSTTQLDDAGIDRVVERALAAAALRPEDPMWPGLAGRAPLRSDGTADTATAQASPEERAAVVAAVVDAGGGLECAGFCSTDGRRGALVTSEGQRVGAAWSSASVDGVARTGTSDGLGHQTSPRLSDLDGAAVGAVAAQKASASAEAVDLEPGHYEVVLEPRAVAEALLFLVIYGYNAKAYADGVSFVHLGEAQMDAAVDLWDDAADPRTVGPTYDVEGTPKQRVELVRAGIAAGLVHDRRTAAAAATESTGHSSGSKTFGPYPANLFLGGGTASREQLIGSVKRGLLVTDFWYNRILDPKTQVVTGLTRNGLFEIVDGEVTRAVKNLRFTQSIAAALGPGKVLGVGDDARLVDVRVTMHVPSLHLADWHFSGGAKG